MRRNSPKDLPRWRVRRIVGNAARDFCERKAKSADEAIKRTIREMEITIPHQQQGLAARPVQ
jgi:hypothetical protein